MTHTAFSAMGTTVEAWGVRDETSLRNWFEAVEATCSRFRVESELSAVNAGGSGSHRMSELLAAVVQEADRARNLTDGLVDAGVGSAVSSWGYDVTFAEIADLDVEPSVERPRWLVDDGSVDLAPGTRLDLGGIAKGWTCDRAVEDGLATVVSAGGDMRSNDPLSIVSVVDPWGVVVARVALGRGSIATSSQVQRSWRVAGRNVSHIIDPRSMRPVVSPVLSITVAAKTAVLAETGAKAALILGEDCLAWAAGQDWIRSAIAVWDDGSVYATGGIEWAA